MRVLDDVKVVELSIAIAAPSCGRMLAFHGADVVKVESRTNPDVARLFGSAWAIGIEQGPYMDSSPYLAEMSADKRSVGLELKTAAAREAALALLADADIFVTNYSTPAVRALGLSYEDVVAVNPQIVYVALPGFGSDPSQPYYEFLAWGPNQAPLVGLDELTGHPDQVPAGIATISPPDFFAGLHALTAVLTGLEHRDRTGEGSFVDIAQFETTVSALGPFLLDHQLTGHSATRSGNRLAWLAPQGVYPCAGEEEWVALTVADDRQWLGLAAVLGDDALGEQYAALDGRLANHDELDALITRWTSTRTPTEAATALQAAGVAAYEVLSNRGVLDDEQIRARRWFQVVPSKRFEDGDAFSGHPIHLGETPGEWWRAGPSMGEDTESVLADRAGLSPEEIAALIESGAAFVDAAPQVKLRRPYMDDEAVLAALGVERLASEASR
jgi:benzylsuccinate CoA-transferase BbsF subunit